MRKLDRITGLDKLPDSLAESNVATKQEKKIMNALLTLMKQGKASRSTGILIISNKQLRQAAGVAMRSLMPSLARLQEWGYITRDVVQTPYAPDYGCPQYTINYTQLLVPPRKKKFEELFADELAKEAEQAKQKLAQQQEPPKMELEQPYIPMTYEQAPEYGKVEHQVSEVEPDGVHAGDFFGLVKGFPSDIEELTPEQATKVCDYRDFTLNTSDEKEAFECFLDDMYGEGALRDIRRIAIDGVKHQINVERERASKQLADDCLEMGMIGLN